MNENELMIAFIHVPRNQIKPDIKEDFFYIRKIQELKRILSRRLIVLSDDFDIFEDNKAIQEIKEIAKTRGYHFDENVLTELTERFWITV